jgi:hypothetical protein
MKVNTASLFVWFLAIILFLVSIFQFSTWAEQAGGYVLSKMFNVTDSPATFYDLLIGLVAMTGSVFIFIGSFGAIRLKKYTSRMFLYGAPLFMIKNLLDIVNDLQPLYNLSVVTWSDVTSVLGSIGADAFQLAWWIFIFVYFTRQGFKQQLRN